MASKNQTVSPDERMYDAIVSALLQGGSRPARN